MKYFETLGEDGRIYLHNDRWQQWREDRLREYPRQSHKFRFDLELACPASRLIDVPVRYPHTHGFGFDPHTCFYECDGWSTIFGVHDTGHETLRMLVESGNPEPIWGERVILLSTSSCIASCIENEPWGMNPPNRFAYFRECFWQVSYSQYLQEWHPPITYPISNRNRNMLDRTPYPEQFTDTEPAARLVRGPNEGPNVALVLDVHSVIWTEEDTDRMIRRYSGIAAAYTRAAQMPPLHEFSEWQGYGLQRHKRDERDRDLPKLDWLKDGF